MIKLLIAFVLAVCSVLASAQTVVPAKYFRTGLPYLRSLDVNEVCIESITRYRATLSGTAQAATWTYYGPEGNPTNNSSGACYYRLPPSTGLVANGSWTKITCTTALPNFDPAVGCIAGTPPEQPPCVAGQEGQATWYRSASVDSPPVNIPFKGASDGTCEIDLYDVVECYKGTDQKVYCTYKYRKTGNPKLAGPIGSSTAGPTAAPPKAPDGRQDVPPQEAPGGSCPKGTVQAGVSADGVPICMGTGSAPKNAPPPPPKVDTSKSEPTPDGGTKTTDTSTTSNSDGSKTTTTTTTTVAPDGTKTVTVAKDTTAATSGGAGKDESTKADEKYDMCKQNPMLTICRNSSVSGTCGAVTCQGDAIQCATLRAASAMECRDKKNQEDMEASALIGVGNQIISGGDSTAADFVKGTAVDMSKQNLDQSGFVSGSCLANRSFSVAGQTVEVSFARVCESIQPLRAVVMACAFIISYLIVSRSVIQA